MAITTEQDYWNERFNEEQRNIKIYYQDVGVEHTRPSFIYKPKIFKDGNIWCALLGDNLQEGVAGFGVSPEDACKDFDYVWHGNHYHFCDRKKHKLYHKHVNGDMGHTHICENCKNEDEYLEIPMVYDIPSWRKI